MEKNEEDKLSQVLKDLNSKSSEDVNFSNLKKEEDGRYSFTVGFKENSKLEDFYSKLTPDQVRKLIRVNKSTPPNISSKLHNKQVREVSKRLKAAGEKDLQEAVKKNNLKETAEAVKNFNKETSQFLDERYKDILRRSSNLDLGRELPDRSEAVELYERSEEEYLRRGIYGTALDILSNFSATGFHNEIADPKIKDFFDAWTHDVNFDDVIVKIFHNLFKYSVVYILPGLGTYEPNKDNVSSLPGQEPSAAVKLKAKTQIKNFFLKNGYDIPDKALDIAISRTCAKEYASFKNLPVGYTILDPKEVEIHSTGFFGGQTIVVKSSALEGIKDLEDRKKEGKLSKKERELLKLIPSEIKKAATNSEDYIDTNNLIQTIYLRKNDFEAYSKPRGSRAFDSFDYKEELVKADYATLDGVFNQILKVTVGDKDNPVTDPSTLDAIAQAFDTAQKAFTIVWHHGLDIEKVTNPEIGNILGIKKYEPVNQDITAALGITRALIDGDTNIGNSAAILSSKALQSEIDAARMKVAEWVYQQYKYISKEVKFGTYPVVRWRNTKITTDGDAVSRASWMSMVDRGLVSRHTAQLALGLDPDAELEKMRKEKEIMEKEGIGIMGSPFQQSKPSGAEGRPSGQPSQPKNQNDPTKTTTRQTTVTSPTQQPVERSDVDFSKMKKQELIEYIKKLKNRQ